MKTTTELTAALQNVFTGVNGVREITLFSHEEIAEMETVRQAMSGILSGFGAYWAFVCFDNNPDLFETAKPLYRFVVLENKQIFKII